VPPPAADAVLLDQRPEAGAGEDAVRAAVAADLAAVPVRDARPAGVGVRRLKQAAHAGLAVGEVGADLVAGDPAAPGIGPRMVLRIGPRVFVGLARRFRALDEKPAVLVSDDGELGEPAAVRDVLRLWI